jgi:xylulokinase
MNGPFLIGIDVGTTAVKAALFDPAGKAFRRFSASYPIRRPGPMLAEQDPADWLRLIDQALMQLCEGVPASAVMALGLTSQVNTHVMVDAAGTPLMPAILWQDGRAAASARDLDAHLPQEDRIAWWGAPLPVDASHVLSRMEHIRRSDPDIWRRTRHVLAPKDYCIRYLTGELSADPMTQFSLIDSQLQPIAPLIGLVEGAAERLPPILPFTTPIGRVLPGFPAAGALVVTGTMDAWAGMFGAGAAAEGDAFYLSGTSEILGIVSQKRVPMPGVIAFAECEGITLHAGPTQSGGASIAWLAALLGRAPADLSALAGQRDLSGPRPLFLPHLQGERAPIWDIGARGAFAGLDAATGPGDLALAAFEGVAYSARWLLDALERSAAHRPAMIRHAGGGAQSDIWCQIRADILDRPIARMKHADAGVLGAALLAGIGAGLFGSIEEAVKAAVEIERIFTPNAAHQAEHAARFRDFTALYEAMKPIASARA